MNIAADWVFVLETGFPILTRNRELRIRRG
jgi:hypothetical protein